MNFKELIRCAENRELCFGGRQAPLMEKAQDEEDHQFSKKSVNLTPNHCHKIIVSKHDKKCSGTTCTNDKTSS